MRKVSFTAGHDRIKKVMLYECSEGVYVFGYDCLQDTSSISDYLQDTVEDAEDFCKNEYDIDNNDWILINDPLEGCQHDFILPTKVVGDEIGNVQWRHFEALIDGHWVDIETSDNTQSFNGMTVNEALFVSGLINEFNLAQQNDKIKADKILLQLGIK